MTKQKRQKTAVNNYTGYTISSGTKVGEISKFPTENQAKWFFDNYVLPRKPVKVLCNCPIDIGDFQSSKLAKKLHYQDDLQIERKHASGFGSGLKREHMKLEQVIQCLSSGDDSYYLTTQYEEADLEPELEPELEDDIDTKLEHTSDDAAGFPEFSDTSSVGSIDFNDLHDDFEDLDEDPDVEAGVDISEHSDSKQDDEEFDLCPADVRARIKELLQPPLSNLYQDKTFPLIPSWLSTLIPQQINLWMGCGNGTHKELKLDENALTLDNIGKSIPGNGNSSGLHHDHADNLYILVEGNKRFTLYSPSDALKLFTVGQIWKVFENGLIDYEINEFATHWKHLRNDGAMLADIAQWKLDNKDYSTMSKQELLALANGEESCHTTDRKDPPSFSKIPPLLLHLDELQDSEKLRHFAETYFPGFLQLNKMEVWLKPGEMLYLPAGWFHEVSSFAEGTKSSVHTAINYWFIPPTESNFINPYQDEYWSQDFKLTLEAIKLAQDNKVEISY